MNHPTRQAITVVTMFGTLLCAPAVLAHKGGKANIAYVGDSSGHLATDSNGRCVITSAWTKELALAECHPDRVAKKPEAKPEPAAAAVTPTPPPAAVVEKITLKAGALFDSGKADLKPDGRRELDDLAARLKSVKGIESIQVTGHTDSQGQAAFNQALSERRAEAVKTYLVTKGVDDGRISTRGMGASNPVASNATAEGRARNRRVELEIKAGQ